MQFLDIEQQADLLARVEMAQQEVSIAQDLIEITCYQAGIDMSVLWLWQQLATECWQVTMQFHLDQRRS